MITEIKICFGGSNWIDHTNDKFIGNLEQLVQYVNENKLRVKNEDVFLYSKRFWYNQENEL